MKIVDKISGQMKHQFQMKVLAGILIPTVAFCIVTNMVIGILFGGQLIEKKTDIEKGYLSVISSYLESAKENLDRLSLYAEGNADVRGAMRMFGTDTALAKKYALDAQSNLVTTLSGNPLESYIDSMYVVSAQGLIAVTQKTGMVTVEQILGSPVFDETGGEYRVTALITESVIEKGKTKLVYLYPIDARYGSWLYVEVDEKLFSDQLLPYADSSDILIKNVQGEGAWYSSPGLEERIERGEKAKARLEKMSFEPFGVTVETMVDTNLYSPENGYTPYIILMMVVFAICLSAFVSRTISKRITKPLHALSRHISRLAQEKVLHTDPSIEEGEDEIAEIGREFNKLVTHINSLIRLQTKMYEQKQKLEMNALQAQINPHFLYNTLDSIRWMAVIQGADSIANTVVSLENLLRNIAKGVGDRIPLREELSLVRDYVALQQVRYVEIFDYICNVPEEYGDYLIVKMTLQPIVENAIFHGIEPTGEYGEIRVSAGEEEGGLYITVEDNGMGMDEAELDELTKSKARKSAVSGIGISNVDERLKMNYGQEYGLSYESKKGRYTRVTVHIPKQKPVDEEEGG